METIAPQRAVQLTLVAELTNKLYGDKNHDVDIAGNNNTHNLQLRLRTEIPSVETLEAQDYIHNIHRSAETTLVVDMVDA